MPETCLQPDLDKARERSVSNLQRLYSIVVGLSLAVSLKGFMDHVHNVGWKNVASYHEQGLVLISFVFVVVPFFHGANRYLDATYVTGERSAKRGALLVDFLVLFAEALAFFVLAMAGSECELFYTLLAGLLFLDIAWVVSTRFTGNHPPSGDIGIGQWAVVNSIAALLILLSVWSNLIVDDWEFWRGQKVRNVALTAIVICRTVYDYYSVWGFYYPCEPEHEQIPAPRPARPPTPSTEDSPRSNACS